MIETILILSKIGSLIFYKNYSDKDHSSILTISSRVFNIISNTKDSSIIYDFKYNENSKNEEDLRIYFRFYGSLYAVLITNELENELATLDFINVMMSIFNEVFEGLSEQIFSLNCEKVHLVLDEMITGGIVIETNKTEIIKNYNEIMNEK